MGGKSTEPYHANAGKSPISAQVYKLSHNALINSSYTTSHKYYYEYGETYASYYSLHLNVCNSI